MFIDTHFHFDGDNNADFSVYLKKSKEAGVFPLIISGCSRDMMYKTISILSNNANGVFASIGYHPEEASSVTEEDYKYLESCLINDKVVAVGEIGLDYHYGKENKEKQKEVFIRQLEIAMKYSLPVVIHTRDAIQDTYDILKNYKGKYVLHCFSESIEISKLFLKLDCYFGIGGVVTFKNSKLPDVVANIPLNRILLETDSPYLAPTPYRGMVNGSWNIPFIAEYIAEIKKVSNKEVGIETTKNAIYLFDLNKKL